ncbi:MAG: hypothetical protein WBQ94_24175, partial [Terracidiphilus sp.]
MKLRLFISIVLSIASCHLEAQVPSVQDPPAQDAPIQESRYDFRYTITAINDTTFYTNLIPPLPASASLFLKDPSVTLFQNQLLLEPSFTLRYRSRWTLASSVVGLADSHGGLSAEDFGVAQGSPAASALDASLVPYTGTFTQFRVKETYAGLSAGDFDFMAGRR